MDELIKKAIEALENSNCNEIEITDINGLKVKVVKNFTAVWYPCPEPLHFEKSYSDKETYYTEFSPSLAP